MTSYDNDQTKVIISQEKTEVNVAVIQTDIGYIKAKMEEINKKFDLIQTQYVTQAEFKPIRQLVFGLVGLILTGVVAGVLSLVINR